MKRIPKTSPTAILPGQHALKNRIVLLFTGHTALTAPTMHKLLSRDSRLYTMQAIYKELRALRAEGIVQKIGRTYALNSPWILQLQSFAARLAATSFSGRAGLAPLLGQAKRQSWKFDNLLAMNDLWGHILVELTRHAERKHMLLWFPHLWFDLFQWEQEDRLMRSYRHGGNRLLAIIGADCFLNRWAIKLFDKHGVTSSFKAGPFRAQMDTYLVIVDDYVVTVRLAPSVARRLDESLRAVRNLDGLVASNLASQFMRDSRCTLTLETNPAKAAKLRRRFAEYFGEKLD